MHLSATSVRTSAAHLAVRLLHPVLIWPCGRGSLPLRPCSTRPPLTPPLRPHRSTLPTFGRQIAGIHPAPRPSAPRLNICVYLRRPAGTSTRRSFSARPTPPMAHRRVLLALTVGLIALRRRGRHGLEESRGDLEAGETRRIGATRTRACHDPRVRRVRRRGARDRSRGGAWTETRRCRAAAGARRRRGFHGRSEAAIDAALDAVCDTLARSRVVEEDHRTATTPRVADANGEAPGGDRRVFAEGRRHRGVPVRQAGEGVPEGRRRRRRSRRAVTD